MRAALALLLCPAVNWAATWGTFNGTTVGTSIGNVAFLDGMAIGLATGNYNSWNGLGAPTSGGGTPSYVNSVSGYCSLSGGGCNSPAISLSAANTAVAAFAYATSSGCGGNTFTAKTSENDTMTLISSVTQSYGCLVMFKIDSLVHTNASEVITFGGITTGPPAYISTGVMQFSNAGGGIDNSQTCSGTGFASPLSCSSALTPTQTNDMAVAAYGEYACNGNVVSSTTLTVPIGGCPAGGNQSGYLVAFGMGYSLLSTTSAFTPSFTDSNVAGNVNEILGTILK